MKYGPQIARKRAVLALLNDPRRNRWSDALLARRVGVGRKAVRDMRRLLPAEPPVVRLYVREGVVKAMTTVNIVGGATR